MNNNQKTLKILEDNLYMTISVASKSGEPWIANLFYAYDADFNFYWYSPKGSVHSRRIRENDQIALAIFDSTAIGDAVDAVYIEAKAYELSKLSDIQNGLGVYIKKLIKTKFLDASNASKFLRSISDFRGLSKLRMYKAVPTRIYKLADSKDYKGKYLDSRIEVLLKDR